MLARLSAADRGWAARQPARAGRSGLTLLEVLVASAIFFLSIIAISRLITMGSELAVDAQQRTEALQLAQAKLAEVVAGVTPLQSQSDQAYDPSQTPSQQLGQPQNWTWSLDCSQGNIPNLWTVQVRVQLKRSDNTTVQVTLNQMVMDPTYRGTTQNLNSSGMSGSASGSSGSTTSP